MARSGRTKTCGRSCIWRASMKSDSDGRADLRRHRPGCTCSQ
jgi:hypothetical protein